MRPPLLVSLALVVSVAAGFSQSALGGAVPCKIQDSLLTSAAVPASFYQYRPGQPGEDLHFRDLEFLWDSLYVDGLGPAESPVRNTLRGFARILVDSTGVNPFGIDVSDYNLVYEYFRRSAPPYNPTDLRDTTSVKLGQANADNSVDVEAYNPSDRSHLDIYVEHPLRPRPTDYGGVYPSQFISGEEDLTTGHPLGGVRPANSVGLKGPTEALKVDLTGTGWTAPGRLANIAVMHEMQHAMPPVTVAGFLSEMISAMAEAVSGNTDTTRAFASAEVPYTWSLLSTSDGTDAFGLRRLGSNYQARSSFGAYLVLNFRGADTSATLAAIHDDLGRRWARSGRLLTDLRRLLRDDSCGTCAGKDYFLELDDTSRVALLLHNWRVAAYVNNSALAEGQYGYPPHLGFSPAKHLKAWQDFNDGQADDLVAIPPEVTMDASHRTRELHLRGSRSFRGSSHPLVLQPLGAEYWVVRSDPSIWVPGQELVVRVTPVGVHRSQDNLSFACAPTRYDGRLVASVVTYAPPSAEVAAGKLWEHPEWAREALDPVWVDVDSTAGSHVFRIPSFGDSAKVALIVLSLADGPGQSYTKGAAALPDDVYTALGEALRYRVDLSLRTDAQHETAPQLLSAGAHPTWAPRDTAMALGIGGAIVLKSFTGGPDNYVSVGSPLNLHQRPDWSPRGDWIAMSLRLFGATTEDVYLHSRETGGHQRLTFFPGYDLSPVFQPNGQRLAYTRRVTEADTLGTWEIRRVDLNGTNDVPLLNRTGAVLRSPRWGPDGNWIYFLANDSLYAVGADGPNQGVVLDVRARLPQARSFDLPRGSGPMVLEQNGADRWQFRNRRNSPDCLPYSPQWSALPMPFRRIALYDTTTTDTIARFYRTGAEFGEPRWSGDNTRIAYSTPESNGLKYVHVGRPSFNHAPVFANGLLQDGEVTEGAATGFGLSATDADGEPVTFQAVYLPPGASLNSVGYFSWPSPGPLGAEYYVVFRALDPSGGVDNRVVKYTVGTGSGGGGCPYADTRTESGWQVENSLLARSLTNALGLDAYRLKAAPANFSGRYHVRLRENEQEYTTVDQVRLVAVDHPAGYETFALGPSMVLGSRVPAARVTTHRGADVTALVNGVGAGFAGAPGDTLLVEWTTASSALGGAAGTFGAESVQDCGCPGVVECENKEQLATWRGAGEFAARPTGVALDQAILEETGIAIQRSDGQGGWRTVRRHYPREAPDGAAFDSLAQGPTRLAFVGRHTVRFIGRLEPAAATPVIQSLSLLAARHSRLGNVRTAVASDGGPATSLAPGDTLGLEFAAPSLAAGLVRAWFLVSRGVYSSAASPAQLQEAALRVPVRFALGQNQPNPFRATTSIQYELPVAAAVRLEVFDAQGRRVRVLEAGEKPAGFHVAEWDRRNASGALVRPGLYLYRMTADAYREHRKMVLLP